MVYIMTNYYSISWIEGRNHAVTSHDIKFVVFSNIRKISKNEAALAVATNTTPIFLFDSAIYLLIVKLISIYQVLRLYSMFFPKGIENRLADAQIITIYLSNRQVVSIKRWIVLCIPGSD